MKKNLYTLCSCLFIFALSLFFIGEVYAYKYHGAKQCNSTVRYKYGSNLQGESLLRNAFRSGLADWNTKQNKRYFSMSDSASGELNTYFDYSKQYEYGKATWNYNILTKCISSWTAKINSGSTMMHNATPARSTAGHELGHILGLDHSDKTALMNSNRDRWTIYVPQADDLSGVNNLY